MGSLAVPFIPYSYGVGRMVGGMLGPGDGSYCGAQIEGTMKHGFLPCFAEGLDKYAGSGDDDLPQGTSNAGRLFGKSKKEIELWTAKAADFDLVEAPKCESADDAKTLVADKQIDASTLNAEQRQAHKNAVRNFVLSGAELAGDGETIVLIHGLWMTPRSWAGLSAGDTPISAAEGGSVTVSATWAALAADALPPVRVVSQTVGTDELLLALAEPAQRRRDTVLGRVRLDRAPDGCQRIDPHERCERRIRRSGRRWIGHLHVALELGHLR